MTSRKSSEENNGTSGIKKTYLFLNVLVISLGFMQFGVGMASFSNTADAWARYFQWDKNQVTLYTDVLQSINIVREVVKNNM